VPKQHGTQQTANTKQTKQTKNKQNKQKINQTTTKQSNRTPNDAFQTHSTPTDTDNYHYIIFHQNKQKL
jgi:hypothetical protein